MVRILAILAGVLVGPWAMWAQGSGTLPLRSFDTAQGMGALLAHTLAQDSQGFMYAAGGEGLFRGDGREFHAIPLPGKQVVHGCLVADAEGPLWAATSEGVFTWRPGETRPERVTRGLPPLDSAPIHALGRDAHGRHWILAGGRPYMEIGERTFAPAPGWREQDRATGLALQPGSRRILALLPRKLVEFVAAQDAWVELSTPSLTAKDAFTRSLVDGRGQLWLASRLGLWRQPVGEGGWIDLAFQTGGRSATDLVSDQKDGVWITGRFGVAHARGAEWEALTLSERLPSGQARTALVDWDGNLWVTAGGLHLVLGKGRCHIYTPVHGLPALDVWPLLRDRTGRIWAGTGDGLAVQKAGGWQTVVKGEAIMSLAEAPDGRIWAAGHDNGTILRIEPSSFRKERLTVLKGAEGRFARGFAFVGDEVWVASLAHGTYVGRRQGVGWAWKRLEVPGKEGLVLRHLNQDREGRCYLAAKDTLHIYESQKARWIHLPNPIRGPVYVSHLDQRGDLWLGSYDSTTLERYRWTAEGPVQAQTLTLPEVQQGMHVYSVAMDTAGMLWVGTSQGLIRVNPAAPAELLRLTTTEGMPSDDSNRPGILATPEGDVWIPTSFGLGRFVGNTRVTLPQLRTPVLSSLQFPDRTLLLPPSPLRFSAGERSMVWRFSAPSYEHQGRLRYELQMDAGQVWLPLKDGAMGFQRLAAGDHVIRVRARLPEGPTSPTATFGFTVLPRWWERRWVQVLGALAAAGLLALGVAWYVRRVRRRNELLERLVQSRTAEIRAANEDLRLAGDLLERAAKGRAAYMASMNHELRNPLSNIMLYAEMMLDGQVEVDPGAARDAFEKIHTEGLRVQALIHSILDLAKLEAGVLSLRLHPVHPVVLFSELDQLVRPELRRHRKFLEIQTNPGQGQVLADSELLNKTLCVVLSFMIGHTSNRTVELELQQAHGRATFRVQAAGQGLSEEQLALLFLDFTQDWNQRTIPWHPLALDLTIVRRYAELMGGSLKAFNLDEGGLVFELVLPLVASGPDPEHA